MKIRAFAKINFLIDLLGKRADGYHQLAMVMQSVSLADELEFCAITTGGVVLEDPMAVAQSPAENLVYKAAVALQEDFPNKSSGVLIRLRKKIPVAAGLAGGSADCAATLLALNNFWGLGLSLVQLTEYANRFGSDIAFCLQGGLALAEGRGELITTLPQMPVLYGILLKPSFGISTAAVYGRVDSKHVGVASEQIIAGYKNGVVSINNLASHLKNDLYPLALQVEAQVESFRELLLTSNPVACQMSGSGPTLFAFYANAQTRDSAFAGLMSGLSGAEAYKIETVGQGCQFI